MVMDFWEAKRKARSRTALYIILFIILSLGMSALVEVLMRIFAEGYTDSQFPYVGVLFALIIFFVAGFQYLNFRTQGGRYVAESLGARQVSPTTTNPKELQLLNVVEEIALAAALPVPPVFILKTTSINAFAAGLEASNAAVTVTEGTLYTLNRDELQGVIAHEFGHISNGDMKISMRLAAMVMGFFFVLYIGLRLLQFSNISSGDDRKGGQPLAIAAIIFFLAGGVMWFFGSILKSAVSREREYLADASAVQFTRNPDGIINALRKIANEKTTEMPASGASFSHLYFDDRTAFSGLFKTHPPLNKRIKALLNRDYIPPEWNIPND